MPGGTQAPSLLIRRLCHAYALPARSVADLPKCCSLVRSRWQRRASLCGQKAATGPMPSGLLDCGSSVKTWLTAQARLLVRIVCVGFASDQPREPILTGFPFRQAPGTDCVTGALSFGS
jgi:hypothetical protein